MNKDFRFATTELRATRGAQGDEDALTIQGRAVGYGCQSLPGVPGPGCRERILPGAFRDSLENGQAVTADFNHSNEFLTLGTTKNRTLILDDRTDGLYFQVRLNSKVQAHRDLHQLVKDGTLSECSFAFGCDEDEWSDAVDEQNRSHFNLRSVKRATLYGISIVANPAYGDGATHVAARSLRYALGPARPVEWSPALRERVAALGKQIAFGRTMDVYQRALKTGYIKVIDGPSEWDWHFDAMTETEFDAHLRRRAERAGAEIEEQRAGLTRTGPSFGWHWDHRQGCYTKEQQ